MVSTLSTPLHEPVIAARGLGKSYGVYRSSWRRIADLAGLAAPGERRVALADVSFDLRSGEGLGLIGENGAGKSTLLKIVAGVAAPSSGEVLVRGRVTSLLELGAGFHPELTGRQNIQLNAALIGLSSEETRERTPEILSFAELGEYIDRPVRTYSTGMAMRLGFAIATAVDPDVLIVDEALSVGDGYFQKKCMDRMQSFTAAGGTLLFCSHAMYYISAFCRQAIWLRNGRVEASGESSAVVGAYERYLQQRSAGPAEPKQEITAVTAAAAPSRLASITHVGQPLASGERPVYESLAPFDLEIAWESSDPDLEFQVGVGVNRSSDQLEVLTFATHWSGRTPMRGGRRHRVKLQVPRLPLAKGEFTLYVFLLDGSGMHVYDQKILHEAFAISAARYDFGLFKAEHIWTETLESTPGRASNTGVEEVVS